MGCNRNTIYSGYKNIDMKGWDKDSALTYYIDIEDTLAAYDIVAIVRHTPSYPYQNLWLFTDHDSIDILLADNHGRWLGSGVGDHKELAAILLENQHFEHPGKHALRIRHGMRTEALRGLTELGIEVKKR